MNQKSSMSAEISKTTTAELDVVTLSRSCCKKFYINAHPVDGENGFSMFEHLGRFIGEHDARIVGQDVFGKCELNSDGMAAIQRACGEIKWPVTWIEGYGRSGKSLTGTQVYAISGTEVEPVELNGRIVGSVFEDDDVRYCMLRNLLPSDVSQSRAEQARDIFEMMENVLKLSGMDFSNVVRTWLYIDKILDWYDEFNEVRTKFFKERAVFDGIVPASTGIGVANPAGAAMVAEAFAVSGKHTSVDVRPIASPLQCPAIDYKSSFSRAIEIALPDHRRLYVSGTASIDPDGATVHVGDVERQIARTMEVVYAILESRGLSWADTSRAIAYFPDMDNAPLLDKYCAEHQLPQLPIAVAHGDICRDDLLFEIEVDAIKEAE